MRAREPDALDPVDAVDRAQELREARLQVASVRVDILAEQRHLLDSFCGELRDLGQDVARPAADLAAADGRDDAVRAHRVAAHRDLHPRLEAALAVLREAGGERALFCSPPRAARNAEAACTEPLREVRDRARAERDVDLRVEREEAVALRFGVAAADGDDHVGALALACAGVAHVRRELRVRLLADRAGVEDDDVRVVLARRFAEPELFEHALDALAVVRIHLAAEGGYVVAAHHAPGYPGPSCRNNPVLAVLGGLGAAVCWAIGTLSAVRASRLAAPQRVLAWVMLTGLVVLVPLLASAGWPRGLGRRELAWLAISGAGSAWGVLPTYPALRIGKASIVSPITSTEGAIAALAAVAEGEHLGAATAVLLAVIVAAVIVASRGEDRTVPGAHTLRASMFAGSAALMFGAGLFA